MKRVLIIDDEVIQERDAILEAFAGTEIEAILCSTSEEGIKWIKSKALFDCVVLDWYLEPESSSLSCLVLNALENKYYAPVMIYTHHTIDFQESLDRGEVRYPKNMIHNVEKNNYREIVLKINEWLENNYTAKLSSVYIDKIYEKIHNVFWNLNKIKDGNIAAVYKTINCENGNINWANDFIVSLLMQGITADTDFRDNLSSLIAKIQTERLVTSSDEKRFILNQILYFRSSQVYLTNGDIIKINFEGNCTYGIIATPDCDFSQKNTYFVKIIELIEFGTKRLCNSNDTIKKGNSNNHFFLPSILVEERLIDFVAIFKSNITITTKENHGERYPEANTRIKYSDRFLYNSSDSTINYICSLVNPYKSDLMQRKNSHDSRIGIPEIYSYLDN
jgi:CheY-like chemotaxis protein